MRVDDDASVVGEKSVDSSAVDRVDRKEKPQLRGIPDVVATAIAIPAVVLLIVYARVGQATTSAWVYGLALVLLFGVSASYHAPRWSPGLLRFWKRLDHSCIYLLIAGSYTPACLLVLEPRIGVPLLWIVWIVAGLGIIKSFAWPTAPRWLNPVVYVLYGWLITPFGKTMLTRLGLGVLLLFFIGGLLYTGGALVYARRWPNPSPRVFGYHEVFHLFVISAGACQFAAWWSVLT
jgi:hemolysin III